ncbi:MAG: hypothetical protein ACRDHL_02700, partial [Candidatus Promineifilaceae bacterium]
MIHIQSPVANWLDAVAQLPAGYPVKAVDGVQLLAQAKARNPAIRTILRHWYDPGQLFGGSWQANLDRARQFFATFIDGTFIQLAAAVDLVEEWNEYNATGHSPAERAERERWAQAAAEVWYTEYKSRPELAHIHLVIGNVAVGNDIFPGQAEAAAHYGAYVGYHAYWLVRNHTVPSP